MALEKVYSIDDIIVRITRTVPPWVTIYAQGKSPTTGWSNGQLIKLVHVAPPGDGVQDYDFMAQSPAAGTTTLPVLTPISGQAELPTIDIQNYWGKGLALKGIRVHAFANSKTVEVVPREEAAEL